MVTMGLDPGRRPWTAGTGPPSRPPRPSRCRRLQVQGRAAAAARGHSAAVSHLGRGLKAGERSASGPTWVLRPPRARASVMKVTVVLGLKFDTVPVTDCKPEQVQRGVKT
jgi:hypothetical protein